MPRPRAPWWIFLVAAFFLAFFIFATYCRFWEPESEGFEFGTSGGRMVLLDVTPNSPAATAGLQAGDMVVSVNGQRLRSFADWLAFRANAELHQPLQFEVERAATRLPLVLTLRRRAWTYLTLAGRIRLSAWTAAQLLTLILAFIIAFSRARDPVALLGAWLLATGAVFDIYIPKGRVAIWHKLPIPLGMLLWVPYISIYVFFGAIAFSFFASFPRRLFRFPWVWLFVWVLPLLGGSEILVATYRVLYFPEHITGRSIWAWRINSSLLAVYMLGAVVTLVLNYRGLRDINERRRLHVIALGSVGALVPTVPVLIAAATKGILPSFFWSFPVQMVQLLRYFPSLLPMRFCITDCLTSAS